MLATESKHLFDIDVGGDGDLGAGAPVAASGRQWPAGTGATWPPTTSSGRRRRSQVFLQPAVELVRLERSVLIGNFEAVEHVPVLHGKDGRAVALRRDGPHHHRADDVPLGVR